MMIRLASPLCGLLLSIAPSIAKSHVSLKQMEAFGGATYEAELVVSHGCEGAATVAIRVQIPEGIVSVQPMPKPGWELETVIGPYATPTKGSHGETHSEGVREIVWSGGNLPDDWFDVFSFRAQLPEAEPGTKIHFPVVQECTEGLTRWIDIPLGDASPEGEASPAPSVTITTGPVEDGH